VAIGDGLAKRTPQLTLGVMVDERARFDNLSSALLLMG